MSNKSNQYQIDRKDAKGCFVESLSDFFAYGKVHFNFVSYDTSRPSGERITNFVNIYIEIDRFLEFCRKIEGGELRYIIQQKRSTGDNKPIDEWLGGISAKKLAEDGNSRTDGMSLSRVAKLLCGNKSEFLFVADSGAGEQNKKGLIVPRFGNKPENHVAISLSWESLCELFLLTKEHYKAWLSSWYLFKMMSNLQAAGNVSYKKQEQIAESQTAGALPQGYDTQGVYQPEVNRYAPQYAGYQQPQNVKSAQYQQYAEQNVPQNANQGYVYGDNYTGYQQQGA